MGKYVKTISDSFRSGIEVYNHSQAKKFVVTLQESMRKLDSKLSKCFEHEMQRPPEANCLFPFWLSASKCLKEEQRKIEVQINQMTEMIKQESELVSKMIPLGAHLISWMRILKELIQL